ncbi:restriction endonuclease subunit S [Bacillus subtilis]|nr:restriction endonuclease subunit S [Bacillus subtilis]CAF1783047.1 hypothetical protein NRS6120_02949 [Bacillus subtilis]CAI6235016.1 Restriction endonuclease subunit S [Bacillus subtilis]
MENKRVPEVRFEGFSEDWEERKLGDFIKSMHGGASIAPDDYQEEGVSTVPKGAVNYSGIANLSGSKFVSEGFYQKNIKASVYSGDLVTSLRDLVPTAPNMGRIVKLLGESKKYLMPQGVYRLLLEEGVDENFMIAFSNSDKFRKIISQGKNGSTQVHIRNSEYLGIKLKAPNSKEQTKIGTFFKQLDDAIALHQHELTTLKQTKQGFLQKMFPKEGESVPEVRFSGFTGDWEQRKLREMLAEPVTDGPHETPKLEESGIPFISVDAIVDNQIDFDRKRGYISEETDELYSKKYRPQYHDVFLVKSGSTVGKTAIVETKERFNIWSPLAAMRVGEVSDPYFLYFLLQTRKMQNQVKDKASSGTQPNLGMRELEKFHTQITPNLEEQKKIGAFFQQLDNLITLHQRELEALKKTKKAFLQKMFV